MERSRLGRQCHRCASIVYANGRYDVFALAPSGNLYQDTYVPGHSWTGFQPDTGVTFAPGSGISAIYADGGYRVYGAVTTGIVYQAILDGAGWHSQSLGGNAVGAPGVSYVDGRYDVFVLAPSGNLYQDTYAPGGAWSGWQVASGVNFAGSTGITALFAGGVYRVYGISGAGIVYQAFYDGTWHSQSLGGNAAGAPGAVYANGSYDVFASAPSGSLWHDTYTSGWSGWNQISGAV